MELREAVNVIAQVCQNFQGNLAQHQQIQAAFKVVSDAVLPDPAANGQPGHQLEGASNE